MTVNINLKWVGVVLAVLGALYAGYHYYNTVQTQQAILGYLNSVEQRLSVLGEPITKSQEKPAKEETKEEVSEND